MSTSWRATGLTSLIALLGVGLVLHPAAAQAPEVKEEDFSTYNLMLKPVGPPVPSFRYELVPSHREQVKNNAALLHHRALHIYSDARPPAKEFYQAQEKFQKAMDAPLKDFPREDARTFLRTYQSLFREEEAAAKCDHCDWGTEDRIAAEGIGLLLPDVQKFREIAFLLKLRTRLRLADGKVDLALRDIQTGLVLARHVAQGPTLIQFLVGNAIAAIFITELEQILQSPDCPNLYWSLTALPRPLVDIRNAMQGELRSMEATIPIPKDIDKGPMTPEAALAALDRLWAGIQTLADEPGERLGVAESRLGLAAYITLQHPSARKSLLAAGKTEAELDAMPPAQVVMLDALVRFRNLRDEHFIWFTAPYQEAIQGMRHSEERVREIRKSPPLDYLQTMLILLLPAVDKVYGAEVRTERRIASLRAVEAVRLQAVKDGKPPAKLSDIHAVPVPLDPATLQPFAYEVAGDKFTISVPPPPGVKPDRGNNWKYVVTLSK
jgi:hypothetical protein